MNVDWKDCDPTLENFLKNIKTLDPLRNLAMMIPVLYAYYDLRKDGTPFDLESLLRENDVDTGLIAVDWRKEEHYKKLVDSGLGAVIKRKYINKIKDLKCNKLEDIPEEYISDYVTYTSCRPRDHVIEETLTHSESVEENLTKLLEAGDYYAFDLDKADESVAEKDIKFNEAEISLSEMIGQGKKLAIVTKMNLQYEFEKDSVASPNAQLVVYAMMNDGSPLSVLAENGLLVSNVGVNIFHDDEGNKCVKYLYLPSLKLS